MIGMSGADLRNLCNEAALVATRAGKNKIEQIEHPLHQQRQDRSRNCALQNRGVIVQAEPAQDRFAQATGAD